MVDTDDTRRTPDSARQRQTAPLNLLLAIIKIIVLNPCTTISILLILLTINIIDYYTCICSLHFCICLCSLVKMYPCYIYANKLVSCILYLVSGMA